MNCLIDIDGTICEDIPNEECHRFATATLLTDKNGVQANVWVNRLYDAGHCITFFTSRTEEHRASTEEWLHRYGFRYHGILMNKPRGGDYWWIDNLDVTATKYIDVYSENP